ncbi:MAG: hypothetical protein IJM37_04865 [Lachnospiraceae bacterium]|nr:hypothetical protein [Lachnospiraceae bacterium]
MHWLFIAGLTGILAFIIIDLLGLDTTSPYEEIGSFGLGLSFGMIIVGVILTSRYSAGIRAFKLRLSDKIKKES